MKLIKAEIQEVVDNRIQYKRFMHQQKCRDTEGSKVGLAVLDNLSVDVVEIIGERFCISEGEAYDQKCIVIGLTPEVEEALGFFYE